MTGTPPEALCTAVVVGYGIWLAVMAFRPRPGFASWHMFAGVRQVTFHVCRGSDPGAAFNPWVHLPHTGVQVGLDDARLLLLYLSRVHGITDLEGHLELRDGRQVRRVPVAGSRVLD